MDVATEDLVFWIDPLLDVPAARREARRQQGRAFRVVRRALSNDPARVAEAVLGRPARVRDLLFLSAGHQGGERRRVLFERYPTLGYRALTA